MAEKSSSPVVYHIVMFSFGDTTSADAAVKEIKAAQKTEGYKVAAEAVVIREADGDVRIHEPGRGGVGGTIGAVTGGLLGLLGGPVGILALAVTGGVAGGVAGHFLGRSIPADELKKAGEALPPNSSAFLVLVEDVVSETMIRDLNISNANVVTLTVGDELSGVVASAMAVDAGSPATATSKPSQSSPPPAGSTGTAAAPPTTGSTSTAAAPAAPEGSASTEPKKQ